MDLLEPDEESASRGCIHRQLNAITSLLGEYVRPVLSTCSRSMGGILAFLPYA
jgi:hypothetical protein